MIKSLGRTFWLCSKCLRQAQGPQRGWRSVSTSALPVDRADVPVDHAPPAANHDDAILRQIFDSPLVWKNFAKRTGPKHVGLFCNAYLTRPEGFVYFAQVSLQRAQSMVKKVLNASAPGEYRGIVRDLDRLSDLLCRVLDMADFVRNTHPSREVQGMASAAWDTVYEYMNELNTMTGLNDQLGKAMADTDISAAWSEEERTVAEMLRLDFSKSAINLPKKSRERFIQLSSSISRVGADFVRDMAPEEGHVALPSNKFQGMDPTVARHVTRRGGIMMPTMSSEAAMALRTVHDADTRRLLFCAARTASKRSVRQLEELMSLRAELAQVAGFASYSHMARDRMMATSPESASRFLRALANSNAPLADRAVADLIAEKKKDDVSATALCPWDRDYYADRIRRQMQIKWRQADSLSSYFSLGTVMQGLSRIFDRLYGIRFVARETLPGETWHPDVRRLDVVSDTDGHVAVLYCDLFYRDAKSPNPAHFTVRCSREISQAEVAEVAAQNQSIFAGIAPVFATAEEAANDGMALSARGHGPLKQLPTVALVCDFPQTTCAGARPALLSFHQMETLFHEMGHAIHSIMARTSFQNVAGTRCATDLAELPSTLMEYFASDPATLALFARHHETDEPLPCDILAHQTRLSRRFEALDTENQILLAMLDQELHSARALGGIDSTAVYHFLQHEWGRAPPDPPGTRWQGFFGHLSGYGSTYYSYIFDRVLAERVWKVAFSGGRDGAALDRANGERLKEDLLRWGGSRDPWLCLSNVLGDERLRAGGESAMALVGSWGTKGHLPP